MPAKTKPPVNSSGGHLLNDVLKSHHCMSCRLCCKYSEEDKVDAPMFTEEAKNRILKEFPERKIKFKQIGKLWQIVLKPIARKPVKKYICPVYDQKTYRCEVYSYRPIDCGTWPFYIMKKDGRILITLSEDCPVVIKSNPDLLMKVARKKITPFMIEQAKKEPDLITQFHGNTVILEDITDLFNKS